VLYQIAMCTEKSLHLTVICFKTATKVLTFLQIAKCR
jgi:hypothetical protein